ncbi:MAG: hypothetical protein LUE09_07515 [Synergistaceae bacterium]|nr:hypothetical protein [Synergistaceae bacterium]
MFEVLDLPSKNKKGTPYSWKPFVLCILLSVIILSLAAGKSCAIPPEPYGRGATVRVGGFMDGGPEMPEGSNGYIYEYLLALAQFTGWKYEFIEGTLAETIERLERGEVDVVGYLRKDQYRGNRLDFSPLST